MTLKTTETISPDSIELSKKELAEAKVLYYTVLDLRKKGFNHLFMVNEKKEIKAHIEMDTSTRKEKEDE